jgi:hypothetical protein
LRDFHFLACIRSSSFRLAGMRIMGGGHRHKYKFKGPKFPKFKFGKWGD